MRLLLDTHAFIWWRSESGRLTQTARKTIASASVVFVSAASAWEIAIKSALGRISLPESVEAGVIDSGFTRLPVHFSHAERVAALPPHHQDPFDRMLVAQALAENLVIVTHDRHFAPYGAEILWT